MGCSAAGGKEQDTGKGILTGHAYSILSTQEYNGEQLIQLRNPWGQKEWEGRWSDTSKAEWTDKAIKKLNHTKADDGKFWMAFDDFKIHFTRLFVCRLYNDSYGKQYYRHIMKGEWKGAEAGGCYNFPTWKNNPQYGLTVHKKGNVVISLTQEDTRITTVTHQLYPIAFTIFKTDHNNKSRMQVANQTQLIAQAPPQYGPFREAIHDFEPFLEPGHYVIVPTTFQQNCEGKFWITILSSIDVDVHYITASGTIEVSHETQLLAQADLVTGAIDFDSK